MSFDCRRSEEWDGHLTNYSKCKASGKSSFKGCSRNEYSFLWVKRGNPKSETVAAALFEQKWKISVLQRTSPASDFKLCHWVMVKPDENSSVWIFKINSSGCKSLVLLHSQSGLEFKCIQQQHSFCWSCALVSSQGKKNLTTVILKLIVRETKPSCTERNQENYPDSLYFFLF